MFGENNVEIRRNMRDYLKTAYSKEFDVGKPDLTGNEGFGYNNYVADAYPIDNPQIKFIILCNKRAPYAYQDDYLNAMWSYQGSPEIQKLLQEIYGEEVLFKYNIYLNLDKIKVLKDELKTLNHSDVTKKYKEDVLHRITYYVFLATEFDKRREAEKIYSIYSRYITMKELPKYYLTVYFLKLENKNELLKEIDKPEDYFDDQNLYRDKKLLNAIFINTSSNLKSPEDVVLKYKY